MSNNKVLEHGILIEEIITKYLVDYKILKGKNSSTDANMQHSLSFARILIDKKYKMVVHVFMLYCNIHIKQDNMARSTDMF